MQVCDIEKSIDMDGHNFMLPILKIVSEITIEIWIGFSIDQCLLIITYIIW